MTLVVTHRWTSFVLGVILLLVTTSGAIALYAPDWSRWTNSEVFTVTTSANPVSVTQAMAIVAAAHPDFTAGGMNVDSSGLIEVISSDEAISYLYGGTPVPAGSPASSISLDDGCVVNSRIGNGSLSNGRLG